MSAAERTTMVVVAHAGAFLSEFRATEVAARNLMSLHRILRHREHQRELAWTDDASGVVACWHIWFDAQRACGLYRENDEIEDQKLEWKIVWTAQLAGALLLVKVALMAHGIGAWPVIT